MHQRWRNLLFLHRRVAPKELSQFLPHGLEIETFDGSAWLGLVPFTMNGIRPRGLPALPWLSSFAETNIRTYVRRIDEPSESGVWFFSLDAARWLGCVLARLWFHLPYFHARMQVARLENELTYSSQRLNSPLPRSELAAHYAHSDANMNLRATISTETQLAAPRTLDHFLIERYRLFSARGNRLWSAQVRHAPYEFRRVLRLEGDQTFVPGRDWDHLVFSDGVDVQVSRPSAIANALA